MVVAEVKPEPKPEPKHKVKHQPDSGPQPKEKDPWKKIKVSKKVKISLHEHELHKNPDKEDNEWACNGIEVYEHGCKSGITDFYQTRGIRGWKCPIDECDFDICKACIQYSIYQDNKGKDKNKAKKN